MITCLRDVTLSGLTSFKIGGPARWYAEPRDEKEIGDGVRRARSEGLSLLFLGRGSNMLVSDTGWPGLVMTLSRFSSAAWDAERVTAQAGCGLDALAGEAVRRGYAGLEELSGIPGSVGGAVVMNAGAFSRCIADTLEQAAWLDLDTLHVTEDPNERLGFAYRTSALRKKNAVVLSARFVLRPGDGGKLAETRHAVLEKRRDRQPLDLPNCGSVFKRPDKGFAGALIEQAGLKGFRYGNAQISPKHANFIVNLGGATAAEVRHLIVLAQKAVYEKAGIMLEPEVVFAGEFEEELYKPD
ncbi:MAG: UDP-N-acetylmuramate dehydrogenase [Chitinispirillaceae bacterium]|nr:UDP-N-acetylmuramate dehydrogenase [Chitinispirillaceae bacterium]